MIFCEFCFIEGQRSLLYKRDLTLSQACQPVATELSFLRSIFIGWYFSFWMFDPNMITESYFIQGWFTVTITDKLKQLSRRFWCMRNIDMISILITIFFLSTARFSWKKIPQKKSVCWDISEAGSRPLKATRCQVSNAPGKRVLIICRHQMQRKWKLQ